MNLLPAHPSNKTNQIMVHHWDRNWDTMCADADRTTEEIQKLQIYFDTVIAVGG